MNISHGRKSATMILLAAIVLGCYGCNGLRGDEEVLVRETSDPDIHYDRTSEFMAFMQSTEPQPPACSSPLPTPVRMGHQRIRVVGIDALNWRVLNLFLARHLLPNIQCLLCSGTAAILRTDVAISPVSWTTIASGKNYDRHGIDPTTELGKNPYDYSIEAVLTPRVWEMMRFFNHSAAIGRYYFTQEGLFNATTWRRKVII